MSPGPGTGEDIGESAVESHPSTAIPSRSCSGLVWSRCPGAASRPVPNMRLGWKSVPGLEAVSSLKAPSYRDGLERMVGVGLSRALQHKNICYQQPKNIC